MEGECTRRQQGKEFLPKKAQDHSLRNEKDCGNDLRSKKNLIWGLKRKSDSGGGGARLGHGIRERDYRMGIFWIRAVSKDLVK